MRRFHFAIAFLLFVCGTALGQSGLERDIRAVLADPQLRNVQVAVSVVRLGDSPQRARVVFQQNHRQAMIPASNMKLLTSAAALDRLEEDFRFRTFLVLRDGDLIVWGDGDPTLGDTDLLRPLGWDVDTVFRNWAEALRSRGVTSVRHVIIDDSVFDEAFYHPVWPENQLHRRYAAQVGGLNLNVNCLDFTVTASRMGARVSYTTTPETAYATVRNTCVMGSNDAIWLSRHAGDNEIILRGETPNRLSAVSVTIHDPPMYVGTVLAETLGRMGIGVTGEVVRDRTTRRAYAALDADQRPSWKFIAVHETPLGVVLGRLNKDSQNLYGEALSKRVGHAASGEPGSWENGSAAVGAFLAKAGVRPEEFAVSDGSGLSRENRISAEGMTRVLTHMFHQPSRQVYIDSLAVGGAEGTLANRFRGGPAGRVFAKSGFISGVSGLSGYLQKEDGTWYAFSILFNGISPGSNSAMRSLQDRVVAAVDRN